MCGAAAVASGNERAEGTSSFTTASQPRFSNTRSSSRQAKGWERFSGEAASIRMPGSESCGTIGAAASAVSEGLPRSLWADERAQFRVSYYSAEND